MSAEVRVLCRAGVAAGFGLAGLQADVASDRDEGARRLEAVVHDERTGVVLVEEDFYRAVPEAERRRWSRKARPLVVPFPGPALEPGGESAAASIAELLRRAVGYRVRLG
jgi:vacuolar-type H+-ATPase subunit F/Vma7